MALSALTIFEVRTTGVDTNGGGFVEGATGTDRTLSDSAFANGTNLTVDAVTNTDVAPDGYSPVAADVGNLIQITAGAGFTQGFYQIASIQSGKWRLDRSPAATGTSGGTWALGGALKTWGKIGAAGTVSGMRFWIKPGTYGITSTTANVANGRLAPATQLQISGYNLVRGDLGTAAPGSANRPVIQAQVNSVTIFTHPNTSNQLTRHLVFDGNRANFTGANGLTGTGGSVVSADCDFKNFGGTAVSSPALSCFLCDFPNNAADFAALAFYFCRSSAGRSFTSAAASARFFYCVASGNSGGAAGFNVTVNEGEGFFVGCISYGNAAGFRVQRHNNVFMNCVAYGNTGAGLLNGTTINNRAINCAFGSNGSVIETPGTIDQLGTITLTADPYTNAAAGDFSLNNAAGGGALLRGLGYGTLPGGLSVGYPDVGAIQHRDAGGALILI